MKAIGATAVALAAVWWFLFRRSLEPGCELQIDAHFAGQQSNRILLEVVAALANKSSVRQSYRDFRMSLRYLRASDPVVDGPKEIAFQVNFPHSIDTNASGKRLFSNVAYIDPAVTFRHSYVTSIPEDATFVLVQCRLLFKTRRHWYSIRSREDLKNGQRLFTVSPRFPSHAPRVDA